MRAYNSSALQKHLIETVGYNIITALFLNTLTHTLDELCPKYTPVLTRKHLDKKWITEDIPTKIRK